jgi:outer membrane lipoprotein-sorting protein
MISGIKRSTAVVIMHFLMLSSFAQDAAALLDKVKYKLNKVEDYQASGTIKTDVVFMKVPVAPIESFYMKPDRFKLKRSNGVSLLPKGEAGINISSLILAGDYTVLDAGTAVLNKEKLSVLKLIPNAAESGIILTTLWIDAAKHVIRKSSTTTRENGTFDLEMEYGKYASWGLPDKVVFYFNTKDYKLPKGITFEYDDGSKPLELPKNKKGSVTIVYRSYEINQGKGKIAFAEKK